MLTISPNVSATQQRKQHADRRLREQRDRISSFLRWVMELPDIASGLQAEKNALRSVTFCPELGEQTQCARATMQLESHDGGTVKTPQSENVGCCSESRAMEIRRRDGSKQNAVTESVAKREGLRVH
jgi:hypothetical protein